MSDAGRCVCAVGTGLPTTTGQTVAVLPGLPAASGPSTYDFWFADPVTLYMADDRAVLSNGGVQKWANVGGTWTQQYILQPANGCRGLTGRKVNGVTTLYATTSSGQLVSFVDNGPGSPATILATAATNTAFRGVRVLQKPTTATRLPAACGAAGIQVAGNGEIGTDIITTVTGPLGLPFVGYGVVPFNLPYCNCTVVHDFSVLLGGASATLPVPNNPALFGFTLYVQGLDFLAPGGCPDPLFTLTDGFSVTLQ